MSERKYVADGPYDLVEGREVSGPVLQMAAKVKELLETEAGKKSTLTETSYGDFYVSRVVISYYGGGVSEDVGVLRPSETGHQEYDFAPLNPVMHKAENDNT